MAALPFVAKAQETTDRAAPLPVIDTHQHLWDLSKFELPWLTDYETLRRNYTLDDYWQAAEGSNIVKTIYMEVDVAPRQRQAEADYVVALCKDPKSRMAGAVVGGDPAADQFAEYVRRLKNSAAIKGIRAAVRGSAAGADFQLDKAFVAGVRLLGQQGLSFDINLPPDQLSRASALVDAAPDTRYVLDHCGNFDVRAKPADVERWRRGMADVGKRKQVVCKVSGFITSAPGRKPSPDEIAFVVNHVFECFGPDRVMFAGDWPVCTLAMPLAEWIATLRKIVADRPLADQKKLFHDNAAKFYGI
jgi:predicted TIM-barrel fold metal-dependent hydrolase